MESLLRQLYQDKAGETDTLGILMVEREFLCESVTDRFDVILIVVKDIVEDPWFVKHYKYEDKKVAMHQVDRNTINCWGISGSNRRFIDWFFNGKILFDRNETVASMKDRVRQFPVGDRKKKIGIEFAKLVRRFEDSKSFYHSGNYLDAFNSIMHALHHQARLAVIESGFYPEVTVWKQVKHIEPETYKLYHELIVGNEPIEKRVELLLIANEFTIGTKMDLGCKHIIDIMKTKEESWSINELMSHYELKDYSVDLELLIEYLVQKNKIQTTLKETKAKGIYHRKYYCR
ncbi:nucleotidyltransferase-like protein [Bacillus sp. FJAT-45350]|uniref:nucleotidyltransferase-like protein n=1 Tax=Bacillus sp. FJAT-45350 TaxID=2011014 RepID=UPI000BB9835C|nr:nucleotidyltransferase-like protein [Bacillus sp. FJAT-45350]